MLPTLAEMLDGDALPAQAAYFVTADTFTPYQPQPVRRLESGDYDLVWGRWSDGAHDPLGAEAVPAERSEATWQQCLERGYRFYACVEAGRLAALCWHRPRDDWRHEVRGRPVAPDAAEAMPRASILRPRKRCSILARWLPIPRAAERQR